MKIGWHMKTLGDLCQVIGGGTPSKDKSEYYSGEIPWATVRDMRLDVITETECKITKAAVKSSSTNIIPGGNVVIATRVGLGKVCLLGQDTAINQDLRGIVPIDLSTLSVRYLFWWLKSIADLIVAEGTGATVQGVKLPFVKSLQIPVPPLPEQQRIVGILDEVSDGIATAKANAEKNLQNARALFESHLQDVFTKRGEDWEENELVEVCDLITCGVAATPKYVDENEGIPFLSAQNVRDGEVVLDKYRHISKEFHQELTKKNKPAKGDILYSRVGSKFGEAGVVEHEFEFSVYVSVTLIKPIKNKLDSYFLKHYLNSPFVKSLALKSISSSGVPNLNVKDVREFPIKYPSISEQKEIVNQLNSLRKETQRLESIYQQKLAALDQLKKSLLHQAFTGQL